MANLGAHTDTHADTHTIRKSRCSHEHCHQRGDIHGGTTDSSHGGAVVITVVVQSTKHDFKGPGLQGYHEFVRIGRLI